MGKIARICRYCGHVAPNETDETEIRNKVLDEAISKFLEYGCVCVEWNKGLSKERLVDDVLRQAMG